MRKRARRISRTINFTRASYNSSTTGGGTSPHTANENFAGAVVNFIIVVATFLPCEHARLVSYYYDLFFLSRFLICEKREYVGGKEDDENYVVTPGSSCQRSSTQRSRYIHGGCGNVFVCTVRRVYFHAYLTKWGKEESTEGEHTELKPYERVQVNARIISMTCLYRVLSKFSVPFLYTDFRLNFEEICC